MNTPSRAADAGLCGCPVCGLVCDGVADPGRCPRCHCELHSRKPESLSRTCALLTAALILYVPANILPVMYTQSIDSGSAGREDTIFSGVIGFWQSGSWDIAAIIFIASILIPSTKFIVLAVLLVNARRRRVRRPALQAQLYRALEAVGYWSMLDVLVVGLVTAVVKFRGVSEAEPRIGILFFGMVVVLTMLGTLAFDPRLLWDSPSRHPPHG